ncbi:hypothetical protein H0E87_007387 [Populus deltoides]|uniref:Uncharacterized protein n=1 Tax=Populus deltoides TaxID=3696 RepID=A0A8T2ZAR3_POPDE|nr:hypothetical protein H0E87_007387 [Populus deltoides]KAH8514527.1 hypothetical protein H0E87_007387 [Populus deltoides]
MNMDIDMNMISRKVTRVRAASVDTNPLRIQKSPSKNLNPKPNNSVLTPPPTETASSPTFTLTAQAVSDVFKRKTVIVQGKEQLDDSYLGCERWLPSRPKVEKPPSVFNAATLAYIDDSIFEDALLQKLLNDNYLSEEERGVLLGSAKT